MAAELSCSHMVKLTRSIKARFGWDPAAKYVRLLRAYGFESDVSFWTPIAGLISEGDSKTIAQIKIDGCPMSTVRVTESWRGGGFDGPNRSYQTDFLVPEPRLAPSPYTTEPPVRVWAVRRREFPLLGKVERADWKTTRLPPTAANELNAFADDPGLLPAAGIVANLNFSDGCWVMSPPPQRSWYYPDKREWDGLLKLASLLLRVPISPRD
jgi:hypothetical protein